MSKYEYHPFEQIEAIVGPIYAGEPCQDIKR